MVVVVDNSYLVSLFLPDEDSQPVETLFRDSGVHGYALMVPALWLTEFGNTMLVCEQRGRLTPAEHLTALEVVQKIPFTVQSFPSLSGLARISKLALHHELSFYDATYLGLALEKGGRLATLDKKLRLAAEAEGVLY